MEKALFYDDIYLVPQYSVLNSRAEADTSVYFLGHKFKLPIVPANMESVINENLAYWLSENGYFYIMHRFNVDLYSLLLNMQDWKIISISCGVNEGKEFEQLKLAADTGMKAHFITIDVAHGHHLKVKKRIAWLKENFPETKIIAGNITTPEASHDLIEWGADALKVGIGQGSICTTRHQTGFSYPMFSAVENCVKTHYVTRMPDSIPSIKYIHKTVPIIADGGIKYIGDIAKAIRAGATMVMAGNLFASCIDSAAKITTGGKKLYSGSTSFEAKKENKHIEGKSVIVDFDVTVEERMKEIKMALQSSISYAGGRYLFSLQKIQYVVVS